MKVAVLGAGNVGVAIAADLSIKGHEVILIKTSTSKSVAFDRLNANKNRVYLKENQVYTQTSIHEITSDISRIADADVIFVTIQSTYHEELAKRLSYHFRAGQIVVVICSYMSSFYFLNYCKTIPTIAEVIGPYLEGRIELDDKPNEVVFRVGCRLTHNPLCISNMNDDEWCMKRLQQLYAGFSNEYSIIDAALLNPNMVLHTVGAIMSIPRIEYSHGNFCMYREAYTRGNDATISIMLQLDKEKMDVLRALGRKPIDVFDSGGFLGDDPMESFHIYSESSDRAISPTSVKSRYITEDVSQGLVLLESIAQLVSVNTPVTTALIDIAGAALHVDFRETGRTIQKLGEGAVNFIENKRAKYLAQDFHSH